ncbi:type II toxin-antitoxin system RelE/ParE family toxin [Aquabacter sp. CN5-332]|uniref:type II toxin-antitoxin system RelE/ParE family toxin n=1 Tax=Aquabacter sp. CN5-332 TaxID=3156608 RepID=UPI0032B5BDA2
MTHKVVFRPRAEESLQQLYTYILDHTGSPDIAIGYIRRIQAQCEHLADLPERAPLRPEVGPGIRVLTFERRVSIAYRVSRKEVEILGIFYGGRFLEGILKGD